MTPVRVAAVGVGGWGRVLADAARQGTGLAIVACTSRSADNPAAFAEAPGCRALPSFAAVLADPEVGGVQVTAPHPPHPPPGAAGPGARTPALVRRPGPQCVTP